MTDASPRNLGPPGQVTRDELESFELYGGRTMHFEHVVSGPTHSLDVTVRCEDGRSFTTRVPLPALPALARAIATVQARARDAAVDAPAPQPGTRGRPRGRLAP